MNSLTIEQATLDNIVADLQKVINRKADKY